MNVILTLSYGHPSSSYVPGHNLSHHKYTQTTKDFMRTSKVKYRWNFLNGYIKIPTSFFIEFNEMKVLILQCIYFVNLY